MPLPNPAMVFVPFDILTAAEMNDLVENDQALAAGTGLDDDAVTTSKIDDAAVDGEKLSTDAIFLGYAQATSNQGSIGGSDVDLTGLSVTVDVPAGGRRVRVTAFVDSVAGTVADAIFALRIKESTTQLTQFRTDINRTDVPTNGALAVWVGTPSAGSHTYKAAGIRVAGTGTLTTQAAATSPAFIMAELI